MVVDHPRRTPRCSWTSGSRPRAPPALDVHTVRGAARRVARARRRGARRHRARRGARRPVPRGFARAPYQGIAARPLRGVRPARGRVRRGRVLVAQGWVYPTDSSINIAIGAGQRVRAERAGAGGAGRDGRWRGRRPRHRVPGGQEQDDAGRPSARPAGARRLRLRTNLEIYWDRLADRGARRASGRGRRGCRRQRGPALSAASRRRRRRAATRRRRRTTRASPAPRSAGATWRATTRASAT